MYLRIEYADHNERFAPYLPRDGKVVRKPKCSDSNLDWYLVRLNRNLEYNNLEYSHLLLASREERRAIGSDQPVNVYILLVPSAQSDVLDGFSYNQFLHIAWGMASVIPDNSESNGE